MSACSPETPADSHRVAKSALATLAALCALSAPLMLAPTKAGAVADQNTNGCTLITAPNGQPVLSCPLTIGSSGPITVEAYPIKVGKGETVWIQGSLDSLGCLDPATCVPRRLEVRGLSDPRGSVPDLRWTLKKSKPRKPGPKPFGSVPKKPEPKKPEPKRLAKKPKPAAKKPEPEP